MGINIDTSGLVELAQNIELAQKDINIFLEETTKELASILLSDVISNTPVRRGTLRRSWTASPLQHVGDATTIDIVNISEYTSYVEYGHRTRNRLGWVPGQFILTDAITRIRTIEQQLITKRFENFLKRYTG